jgi:small GTP-binding protein
MPRLEEALSLLYGRVEILALGGEDLRRAAEKALERGKPMTALRHARALLARVPGSPVALGLWADAADAAQLDGELTLALEQLLEHLPWRQELWLRLGLAKLRLGQQEARAALERAAAGVADPQLARRALLLLCDLDRQAGDPARAMRWLDRAPRSEGRRDPEHTLRRVECLLETGELAAAQREGAHLPAPSRLDGRDRLAAARIIDPTRGGGEAARALDLALGAHVLGARGAERLLAQLVAQVHRQSDREPALAALARVRRMLEHQGRLDDTLWRAAFALGRSESSEARAALLGLLAQGDEQAASTLLGLAEQTRDLGALRAVAMRHGALLSSTHIALLEAARLRDEGRDREALGCLATPTGGPLDAWVRALEIELVRAWIPRPDEEHPARWPQVLGELREAARAFDRLDLLASIEALAVERERPLRVALLGEFNAGKSTLLNALLGTDVAPTGVLPTTASLHWVAWAPDPFVRVTVRAQSDRIVSHDDLKRTLDQLRREGAEVERVLIYAPIERLKRIELLDTPGFNAPFAEHAELAEAAVREAHVALWLLDATAPLKETERLAIERIAAAGVPVQVLVNKLDRLHDGEADVVMAYVARALGDAGLPSLRPPVGLSARLALRGRLGDRDALDASNWQAVEQLLSEHIVNRCDVLRERGARRKAAAIADDLDHTARGQATRFEQQAAARAARLDALRLAASKLDDERPRLGPSIGAALSAALAQLEDDARPIERIAGAGQREVGEVRDYLVDRTVDRLAPPLAQALGESIAGLGPLPDGREPTLHDILNGPVRAALAGAAAAHRASSVLSPTALRAVIDVCFRLSATALRAEASAGGPELPAGPRWWRLEALSNALRGKPERG